MPTRREHPHRRGPAKASSNRALLTALMVLHCPRCPLWYGAENDEYGPCQVKHARGDARFVTFGNHACDEGFDEASWK